MSRTVIVGTSASGKTTFAKKLSAKLGSAHIELDQIHWLPGWKEIPNDELRKKVQALFDSNEHWVVDGNYSFLRDLTWPQADTIIWLNYSFLRVFGRGMKRTVSRMITGKEVCNGNKESFRLSFLSKDSVLLWIVKTHGKNRKMYNRLLEEQNDKQVIIFKHPKEAERWIQKLT